MNQLLMNSFWRVPQKDIIPHRKESLTTYVCGTWKILPISSSNTKLNEVLTIFVSSTEKMALKFSIYVLLFVKGAKGSMKVK